MAGSTAAVQATSLADTQSKLDPDQVLKAADALLKHLHKARLEREAAAPKKNLLLAETSTSDTTSTDPTLAEPIWLILTTKKHIASAKSLKPHRIPIPHSLNPLSSTTSILLIVPDPATPFTQVLESPAFPSKQLASAIHVHSVANITKNYKTFEQRRVLHAQHDLCLADERIITMLPRLLGKIFYESSKRPIPVRLEGYKGNAEQRIKDKDARKHMRLDKRAKQATEKSVAKPETFAREVEKVLNAAYMNVGQTATTAVKVGLSSMSAKEVKENLEAVVGNVVEKMVGKGWKGVRSLHVKGPESVALPIWLAGELWEEEGTDVVEQEDADERREREKGGQGARNGKRKIEEDEEGVKDEKNDGRRGKRTKLLTQGKSKDGANAFSADMLERKRKLREQKEQARAQMATVVG